MKKIVAYASVIFLLGAMIYGFFLMKKVFKTNTNFEGETAYVYIPTNSSPSQVLDSIKKKVKDWDMFYDVLTQFNMDRKLSPGRFRIKQGMNNYDIALAMQRNIPLMVTFNNKERIEDLAKVLARKLEPDYDTFYKSLTDSLFLADNEVTKEQALVLYMPNTYKFRWNTRASKVRNSIRRQYIRFWNKKRQQKAKKIGLTQPQVVSLAAIVQKESAKPDERPRVAGVYLNRLQKNILLQADPTVIYAVKKQANDFSKVIKRVWGKYLKVDNLYNTYKYAGVPPGPITMPDEVSIDAVLNAEKHDYIYFCASVEKFGYHNFAKNLRGHGINRAAYIKWLNKNKIK